MKPEALDAYRKYVSDIYNRRSEHHDKSDWHRKCSLKLINDKPPDPEAWVLDAATGTGTIAFHAAALVGPNGKVIGVDLSPGMLEQANKKLAATHFQQLEFIPADMEHLDLDESSFDRIYCASAFFCVLNPPATLRHWYKLLKPGGILAFHALPETSYFWVAIARNILAKHGFSYLMNTATGNRQKTQQLLMDAGYINIDILEIQSGYYVPYEKAIDSWIGIEDFVPGQYPHPVQHVPDDILLECKKEYESEIEKLNTDQGVWNDISMYYVYAQK